jgi:hypothetical protein
MTTGGAMAADDVALRRPFGWGVLFLGDSRADHIEVDPETLVTWGREDQTVAVLVRHAQDVDADVLDALADDDEVPEVEVSVNVHWGAADTADVEGVIAVPSGVLAIGDADVEEPISVTPGRWCVQISLEPREHAERVDVWLTPAS